MKPHDFDPAREAERARSALWHLDAGCPRPEWVRLGMAAKAAGLTFEDWHAWSETAGNYRNEADCRATWNSMKGDGIGPGTLFAAARAAGWQDVTDAHANAPGKVATIPPERARTAPAPRTPREEGKDTSAAAAALWGRFAPAPPDHAYLIRKGIAPDGLRIASAGVTIAGHDARGVLFGVGRLLREMALDPGRASVPDRLELVSAPAYPLRGHQLGYRPKCNSYDAWDVPTWEQYYRDLAVFGCNAIELIPPRSDDDADSPHFPRPPLEMMVEMSRLAADYGLDLWIWYPAMDKDYADPATVNAAVAEWAEVFKRLPRLDAVFVPGGDPGHTPPKALLGLLEKQTESLHRFHPRAQMWVSPQGFNQEWYEEFTRASTNRSTLIDNFMLAL